jgi:hypothetical protein
MNQINDDLHDVPHDGHGDLRGDEPHESLRLKSSNLSQNQANDAIHDVHCDDLHDGHDVPNDAIHDDHDDRRDDVRHGSFRLKDSNLSHNQVSNAIHDVPHGSFLEGHDFVLHGSFRLKQRCGAGVARSVIILVEPEPAPASCLMFNIKNMLKNGTN